MDCEAVKIIMMKNSVLKNSLLTELSELSFFLGSNLDLIQGAGGNTSVKDNNILWVKASGFWLSDALDKKIFAPLDREAVFKKIQKGEENLDSTYLKQFKLKRMRPSIETTMHALMRHRFVAHVHSVNVISHAVLKNCREILSEKLKGINWLWVPYVKPGLSLTKLLNKMNVSNFDVIILANHGLVVGGDSKEEVLDALNQVESRLIRSTRKGFNDNNIPKLEDCTENTEYKLPKYRFCHALAKDRFSMDMLAKKSLYPDHVIFLGPESIPIIPFKGSNQWLKEQPLRKVVAIKDLGIVVNKNLSQNAEEMLHCYTNVLLRLNSNDKLNHLTKAQEIELLGWDAEKYRKSIQR